MRQLYIMLVRNTVVEVVTTNVTGAAAMIKEQTDTVFVDCTKLHAFSLENKRHVLSRFLRGTTLVGDSIIDGQADDIRELTEQIAYGGIKSVCIIKSAREICSLDILRAASYILMAKYDVVLRVMDIEHGVYSRQLAMVNWDDSKEDNVIALAQDNLNIPDFEKWTAASNQQLWTMTNEQKTAEDEADLMLDVISASRINRPNALSRITVVTSGAPARPVGIQLIVSLILLYYPDLGAPGPERTAKARKTLGTVRTDARMNQINGRVITPQELDRFDIENFILRWTGRKALELIKMSLRRLIWIVRNKIREYVG